ncbi:MAG: MFS transporter, partial [Chloroflexaceae bacterium]|nr:MFS transporter [Chloroflexaceae bacterium]
CHPERTTAPPLSSVFTQVQAVLSNRPYLFVVGIYMVSWLALQITAAIIPFYTTYLLQNEDVLALAILGLQGMALLCLFGWNSISHRIGKQNTYLIGAAIWIGAQLALFFVQPEQVALALFIAAVAGIGVSTSYLIPWSLVPDVVDYHELQTGQHQEGMFYGLLVFAQKLGLALGLFIVGVVLAGQGFDQNLTVAQQPESAVFAIRLLISLLPAGLLVVGMVLAFFFPITQQQHAAIAAELAQRRATGNERR